MLFVYVVAISLCVSVLFGCVALLSVGGVWCASHVLAIFVLLCVCVLCTWATVTMFNAARAELVYWF